MPQPSHRIFRAARLVVVAALLAAAPVKADDTWVEVTSPHFTVVSNAGEKRARNMAWQFEQVQAVLQKIWPWAKGSFDKPLVVYAVKDERSMRTLAPQYWEKGRVKPASLFLSAPDAHFIAVRTDVEVDRLQTNPYRTSYWSYVGLTLNSSIPHALPLWYSRGLCEVFSNTIVRDKEVLIGPIMPWHLDRLRERQPLSLNELVSASRNSAHMTDGDRMAFFDASAWALMHYLTFGNEGRNLSLFNKFSIAVGGGAEATGALAEAFGGLQAVEEGYRRYIGKMLFTYKALDLAVEVDPKAFTAKTLTAPEADLALARYYVASSRPIEARASLDRARPVATDGALHELEGLLLDRENRTDEARMAYERAVDLGGTTYYGPYRFASLSWPKARDGKELFAKMETSLRRAIELRPGFAPAHAMLANVLLELERPTESLVSAQQAVKLDAFESYHQLTLARALFALGKAGEAIAPARHAQSLARTSFDEQRAERFLQFLRAKTQ